MAKFKVYTSITGLQPKDHFTSNPVPYRGNFSSLGAILSVSIARIPAILLYPSRKSVTEAIGRQLYMNIAQICGRPFTRSIGNIKKEPSYITEAGNHRVPLKQAKRSEGPRTPPRGPSEEIPRRNPSHHIKFSYRGWKSDL